MVLFLFTSIMTFLMFGRERTQPHSGAHRKWNALKRNQKLKTCTWINRIKVTNIRFRCLIRRTEKFLRIITWNYTWNIVKRGPLSINVQYIICTLCAECVYAFFFCCYYIFGCHRYFRFISCLFLFFLLLCIIFHSLQLVKRSHIAESGSDNGR